jgi:bifunctional non-homologous end joining protein LigD
LGFQVAGALAGSGLPFVIPARSILASKPPSGPGRVHEIKHDGDGIIVRRDGPTVRLYSRNVYDSTVQLATIAAAAEVIKAKRACSLRLR